MSNQKDLLPATNESVFSLQLFEHAQRVAKMLSSSDLLPVQFKGNVQNTMIAMEMANRIGASPLMVMQNLYVVYGKPGWSATFIIAGINSCKRFSTLQFRKEGTKGSMERTCVAFATDLKSGDVLESPEVSMKMAKNEGWLEKKGSKWQTIPELMLMYRSATFFGRLYAPELLMGMQTSDEIVDIQHQVVDPEPEPNLAKEDERIVLMIQDAKTVEELEAVGPHVKDDQLDLFTIKMDELKAKK
jgi:hypothetical protein